MSEVAAALSPAPLLLVLDQWGLPGLLVPSFLVLVPVRRYCRVVVVVVTTS